MLWFKNYTVRKRNENILGSPNTFDWLCVQNKTISMEHFLTQIL